MVDEREDRYDDEEGEYHFSDDQLNYEEVEAPKATQSTGTMKKSVADKLSALSPSRRMLVAGVVFVSLIGIVYKMLSPGSTELPTDIAQIEPIKATQPTVAAKPKPVAAPTNTASAGVAQPTVPATPVMATTPAESVPTTPPAPPSTTGVVPVGMQTVTQAAQGTTLPSQPAYPANQVGTPPPTAMTQPTQPTMIPSQNNVQAQGNVPPVPVPQAVADRVKAVEDHNTAMMNLLQTEYAQKLSDFEMQSSMVRGKMDEMAKRINRIETSLNQITQMLQQNSPPAANKAQPMGGAETAAFVPAARPSMPKNIYTVQAIIPGRAWLKADSGDTVTVAEGDTLRDYGRISKIDPYDGVVEIDTGSKVIALSYGMNAE